MYVKPNRSSLKFVLYTGSFNEENLDWIVASNIFATKKSLLAQNPSDKELPRKRQNKHNTRSFFRTRVEVNYN